MDCVKCGHEIRPGQGFKWMNDAMTSVAHMACLGANRKHRCCGTCVHSTPSAAAPKLVDCNCPIPFFAAEFPGNLDPDGGRDCPAWK